MPTSLATLMTSCGRRFARASMLLFMVPGLSLAMDLPVELKRAESLQPARIGRVSDDERSVLRIEWRAALSRIDEVRRLDEITDRLRGMEASMVAVDQLVRNMPQERRIAPANAMPATEEAESGFDWRVLAVAATALLLGSAWWFGRRRVRQASESGQAIEGKAPFPPPSTPIPPTRIFDIPPAEVAEEPAAAPQVEDHGPVAEPPVPDMVATVILAAPPEHEATALSEPPPPVGDAVQATMPSEPSSIVDFVLEEADPGTVIEEPPAVPRTFAPVTPKPASERNLEPTLQLAEIMLSMGLEQGAAQALFEYTEANPRHAVYHMLKLLGIYRKRGLQEEFVATAEKLRKNFNIQAEDWGSSGRGEPPTLENFARIAEHIQSIWARPEECMPYLRHLLEDNRDGARAGFPQSVAEEILLLLELLKDDGAADQAIA